MGKVQKVYTKEFKQEAVRLVQTSGKPITQIARELGVSDSAILSWRKELAEHGKDAFAGCTRGCDWSVQSGHRVSLLASHHTLKQGREPDEARGKEMQWMRLGKGGGMQRSPTMTFVRDL